MQRIDIYIRSFSHCTIPANWKSSVTTVASYKLRFNSQRKQWQLSIYHHIQNDSVWAQQEAKKASQATMTTYLCLHIYLHAPYLTSWFGNEHSEYNFTLQPMVCYLSACRTNSTCLSQPCFLGSHVHNLSTQWTKLITGQITDSTLHNKLHTNYFSSCSEDGCNYDSIHITWWCAVKMNVHRKLRNTEITPWPTANARKLDNLKRLFIKERGPYHCWLRLIF
jgi:hypothetical protein